MKHWGTQLRFPNPRGGQSAQLAGVLVSPGQPTPGDFTFRGSPLGPVDEGFLARRG